jgi:hypothetical protein
MGELQFQTADSPRLACQRPMTAIHAAIRVPRVRWGIGALLGAGVLINYFDRINLSVGAPQLQQEFGLTDGELGSLSSGFFWFYALLQIPTGMILDRFGVTSVHRVGAFLWSFASGATAFASGFIGILAARLVLGVTEGPAFPASGVHTDVHAHPELSMQERTAGLAAERLRVAGYDVTTAIGKTGVVGLLRNGEGPTVMLRADMDALRVEEATGLPYASRVRATDRDGRTVPVMHACGHDMHVAWLAGATTLFAQARDTWRGTLIAVFQPAGETGEGAQAMIEEGLFDRFPKPDVVLGQHMMVGTAGTIGGRAGVITFRSRQSQRAQLRRGRRASASLTRSAGTFPTTGCARPGRRRQARISDRLARNGTRPPYSGSWAAPTPVATRKPRRRAGSTRSRPTTIHALRRLSIRACRRASRP